MESSKRGVLVKHNSRHQEDALLEWRCIRPTHLILDSNDSNDQYDMAQHSGYDIQQRLLVVN